MAIEMTCPYWRWRDKKKLTSTCEGGCLSFKDAAEQLEYFRKYCASLNGWEGCSLAGMLDKSYEEGRRA